MCKISDTIGTLIENAVIPSIGIFQIEEIKFKHISKHTTPYSDRVLGYEAAEIVLTLGKWLG